MKYRQTPHHLFNSNLQARPKNAGAIWRTLCWVNEQVAISGDLSEFDSQALIQLNEWVDQGITDIIDLRGEASHERFVAQHASHITYHWLGVDDAGDRRSNEWFEAIEAAAQLVLQDPSRKMVIHCHMGVNRGPSAAFTALITHGVDPIQALTQIRSARPVAAILYSFDAVQWYAQRQGKTEQEVADLFQAVYDWHVENPLDLRYCIQQIGSRYAA